MKENKYSNITLHGLVVKTCHSQNKIIYEKMRRDICGLEEKIRGLNLHPSHRGFNLKKQYFKKIM